MYAIIENELVIDSVVADEIYAQERGWVLMPEFAGIGWSYIDGVFIDRNKVTLDASEKIKADIAALEATITPRRTREAILGTDIGWLADIENQIQELRGQL